MRAVRTTVPTGACARVSRTIPRPYTPDTKEILPMSTVSLLDRSEVRSTTTAATRLRATMAAARVSFTWFGVKKSLTAQQKAQAAQTFDAEGQFLSATKKLLDTKAPRVSRRHGDPGQDRTGLEIAEPSVP